MTLGSVFREKIPKKESEITAKGLSVGKAEDSEHESPNNSQHAVMASLSHHFAPLSDKTSLSLPRFPSTIPANYSRFPRRV